ncbi:putative tRNA binding domain [Pelomyxa schiedti]|nr:putative tRNA binding domain [Pelomyxa schiedti]
MLVDYHIVVDLMPRIGYLVFTHKVDLNFLPSQLALLCGMSLQHRTLESIAEELKLEVNQVMSMFNKIIRKCSAVLSQIYIDDAAREAIAEEKIATEAAQKAGVVNNPAIPRTLPAAVQKQDAELLGVEPPAEDTTTTTATGKRPRNDRESSTTATAASDKASVKELVSALNLTKYVLPKGVVDQVKAAVKESGGSVDEVVQQLDLPIPTVDVAPPKNKKSKAFRRW